MNFSKSSKLSKILSLILVLTLIASLFAGCKKDEASKDPSDSQAGPSLIDPEAPSAESKPEESEPAVVNENMATILSKMIIRSAPVIPAEDPNENKLGELEAGDKVEISRREGVGGVEWAYITSPTSGWIMMEYVQMDHVPEEPSNTETNNAGNQNTPEETKPAESTTQSIKGVVTTGLNIRNDASKEGTRIVGNYNKGDVITILETKNGWGRTDKGWVLMEYVNTSGTTTNNNSNNTTSNNDDDKDSSTVTGNGSTTVQFKGIVTATQLNVRVSPSTDAERVGSLNFGARVEILEKSGNWGRTKDGWISLDHVYQDGTTGSKTAKGIITGSELNIRSGPGTGYASVGSLDYGDRVTILEQFTYNNVTWGCTKNGWISMQYVYVDGKGTGDDIYGIITADELNIRGGPGTGYDSVGSLEYGDEVTILFELEVGDTTWGNIDKGWISMDYVELY